MDRNKMRYLKTYKLFESKSSLKFTKQPSKKGAKTETYNVIKDGEVIGQIKWSSRMRGYAFLPEKEHDDEIKDFIKGLMNKRKESKTNESIQSEESREMMIKKYGEENIEECNEVLKNIEHMSFEVQDLGITVLFGYTPMTFLCLDTSPKIYVSIIADERLYAGKIADIDMFKDTLLGYVRSLGFSTGQNTFTSDDRKINNQILIQK
jgi:hypothetical protein